MNERITFVSTFDDVSSDKILGYLNRLDDKLCKVPFGKNVLNREEADTLPYHFTLMYWEVELEREVLEALSKIQLSKVKVVVDDIKIIKGSDDSYELFFNIEENEKLKLVQQQLYDLLPSDIYKIGRRSFHISIHADKDYDKVLKMKEILMENFSPFELNVSFYRLYRIYPAELVFEIRK